MYTLCEINSRLSFLYFATVSYSSLTKHYYNIKPSTITFSGSNKQEANLKKHSETFTIIQPLVDKNGPLPLLTPTLHLQKERTLLMWPQVTIESSMLIATSKKV